MQDVNSQNYDTNEKIKNNREDEDFDPTDSRVYVKNYKVPGFKETLEDGKPARFRIEQRNDIELLKALDKQTEGHGGALIARPTGVGKTNIALGFFATKINENKDYKALIAVPKGRLDQWVDEAHKFTDLDIVKIPEGLKKEDRRELIFNLKPGQIAVINQKDAVSSYQELYAAAESNHINGIAIDEPQELVGKAASGNMAAAVRKLTALPITGNRIALTATPATSNLTEAYDLVNWFLDRNK